MTLVRPLSVTLTPRELTIIRELMKDGATNERIGARLFLSVDTVKTHVKNILRKTCQETRTSLVVALWRREVIMFDSYGRVIEP